MTEPRVTVIVPTYNRCWGLRRAVAAALAQTYPLFEVLVMDDASTDDTAAVARSLADPRVRYHRQPANVGVGRNWGDGLRRAVTPYVCFLMDDDFPGPTFLENRVRLLDAHPEALVAFSGYRRVRPDGSFLADVRPACAPDRVCDAGELLDVFFVRGGVFVGAMLYRREPVAALWAGVERYDLVVDYALNMDLALLPGAKGVCCGAVDFHVCTHERQLFNAANDRVYRLTHQFLNDRGKRGSNTFAAALRRIRGQFLTNWAYAVADRDRAAALTRLAEAIALVPFSRSLWRRWAYIFGVILGLRRKPA